MDRHQVAQRLGVSEKTVIRLEALGALPAVRLPTAGSIRYHPARVESLMSESLEEEDDSDPREEALTAEERNPTINEV